MTPGKNLAKIEIGRAGQNTHFGNLYADEFQRELSGRSGIKKWREMRDQDATIGAVMYATEQVLRDVKRKVVPAEGDTSGEYANFLNSVLDDMEHTLDDHISEALSSLTYGFASFEVVYKRRVGPDFNDKKRYSKFDDGKIGIRKLASRAQWTINQFDVDKTTGDLLGIRQDNAKDPDLGNYIPAWKLIHYRTTTVNNDPAGRSILRNAYKSYTYLTNLQAIEAIAVERELHGVPVGRMPADYLQASATDDQKALKQSFEAILRDLKLNEQGYALLPSDVYMDDQGKPSAIRMMDIELITSNGSRNVEIDPIITRYQHDIARSVMAEFLMLGSKATGSYALSKSKTDLFLRSMESYINTIYDVLNKQLVEPLWRMNGFDVKLMPRLEAGDVAPHDLDAISSFLRNLNGANIDLSNQPEIINDLLEIAELPPMDEKLFQEAQDQKKEAQKAELEAAKQPKVAPAAAPKGKANGKS